MDNNPKMKKSTKYLLIGTLVLFLSILGASVAYYLARVSGNLSGRAAGTELNVQVQKISSKAMGDLIPLDNDLETLQLAAAGYQDKGACVDINGYSVCQIYKITVTNNGSIDLKMNGTVTLSGQNTPNIDCAKMSDATTVANNNSCMGVNNFVSGDTLPANNHKDYYVMVYINNLDEPQYDSGEFNGVVTFITEDGRKVKGRFTKPFNLVQRIETLYNDAEKSVVTANAEAEFDNTIGLYKVTKTIDYSYATNVGLMKDRFGGTTSSLDGGNIRYYGANPNNYIDIGDKYETDYSYNVWEKELHEYFENIEGCQNYFNCSTNYEDLTFASEEECNSDFAHSIAKGWYDIETTSNQDFINTYCKVETIPAGTPVLWRIIGVFDGKLRVIRDESIGNYSWDTSAPNINDGYGINEWSQADLMKLLNPGYENNQVLNYLNETITVNNSLWWNSGSGTCYKGSNNSTTTCDFTNTGLSEEAKEYVVDQTINLGGINWATENRSYANQYYNLERGNNVFNNPKSCDRQSNCNDTVERTLTWTGKVGLKYPSDYGYATDFTKCTDTLNYYESDECKTNDWLFSNYWYWTMSPDSSHAYDVWHVNSDGAVTSSVAYEPYGVRPVLTLSSETLAATGTGSKSAPYVLTS